MSSISQIVALAALATEYEERDADAAALLIDAALLIWTSAELPLSEINDRVARSYETLSEAQKDPSALISSAMLKH